MRKMFENVPIPEIARGAIAVGGPILALPGRWKLVAVGSIVLGAMGGYILSKYPHRFQTLLVHSDAPAVVAPSGHRTVFHQPHPAVYALAVFGLGIVFTLMMISFAGAYAQTVI
jgi:hypothetical protein